MIIFFHRKLTKHRKAYFQTAECISMKISMLTEKSEVEYPFNANKIRIDSIYSNTIFMTRNALANSSIF